MCVDGAHPEVFSLAGDELERHDVAVLFRARAATVLAPHPAADASTECLSVTGDPPSRSFASNRILTVREGLPSRSRRSPERFAMSIAEMWLS